MFESAQDGYNLSTLYSKAKMFGVNNENGEGDLSDYHYCLLLIHTTSEAKFGAFISAFPKFNPKSTFVGTSESFVFSFSPRKFTMHQAPLELNKYYMHCDLKNISIGSGYDGPAIRIDENLNKGISSYC